MSSSLLDESVRSELSLLDPPVPSDSESPSLLLDVSVPPDSESPSFVSSSLLDESVRSESVLEPVPSKSESESSPLLDESVSSDSESLSRLVVVSSHTLVECADLDILRALYNCTCASSACR